MAAKAVDHSIEKPCLTRCTSTPLNPGLSYNISHDSSVFVSPIQIDSGFESQLSVGGTSGSTILTRVTRSRSRHLRSDLRKYPKNDDDSGVFDLSKNSPRIVYRPGLFEGYEFIEIIKRLNDMGTGHILALIWRH